MMNHTITYESTHYARRVDIWARLTFSQRLRLLVGLPVSLWFQARGEAIEETPLTSQSLDVVAVVTLNG